MGKKNPYYEKNMSTDIPGSSYTMGFVAFSILWKTDGEIHAFSIWRDWLILLYASLAFYKETSHLVCTANQMSGFYIKCRAGLQWFNVETTPNKLTEVKL